MSIQSPNYTQIPNEILDVWMEKLTGSEFKILMKICRNTFGWKKKKDRISTSQLMIYTGLSNRQVITSVKKLAEYDLIKIYSTHDRATKEYEISCEESSQDKKPLMKKVHKPYEESSQENQFHYEESSHTKEREIKKYINKKEGRFKPPTPAEIKSYLDEIGNNTINPESFHNYYQAKGWMIGKNKMKDWKAAVRTWVVRDKEKKTEKKSIYQTLKPLVNS